jgi:hypothetical protein
MNFTLLKRYISLAVWIVAVSVVVLIPFKIISLGFLPMDDALRHAAKTISGKSWQEILVMRSDFAIDPSPGWQKILEWAHAVLGGNAETLVVFSVVSLMLLVTLSAFPWLRRPEAWLGAILAAAVFAPACTTRFMRGRPYILTDFVVITILLLWSQRRKNSENEISQKDFPSRAALIFTPLLVAVSAWTHGSWYMLILPGAAIFFSGLWRSAFIYGFCWLFGSFLGSALTGHPWEFLFQAIQHMFGVFGNFTINRQLESEFYPSDGETVAVLLVAAFLLWHAFSNNFNPRKLCNPIFVMMILGWLLGLKMRRFWWDYGIPAFMLWIAFELQQHLERHLTIYSAKRLVITLALAAGAFFSFTSDRDGRWTENLTAGFLDANDPALAGWLPESGGIIYNSDMDVFFKTFYKNPTAPWHYILGFEPGLMLPENLAVLRKAEWNFGDAHSYEPWVHKMQPGDRLIIHATGGAPPNLPELEWNYAATETWIGRLPRAINNPVAPQK